MAKTISLGFKSPYFGDCCAKAPDSGDDKEKEERIAYPQLRISDEAAQALMGMGLRAGDEVEITIKGRVVGVEDRAERHEEWGGREAGSSMDLELTDMSTPKKLVAVGSDKEETTDDAFARYEEEKGIGSKKD